MAVDVLRSPALINLMTMKDNSGYISKIRKINETLDQDVTFDDLMSLWNLASDLMLIISGDTIVHANDAWASLGYNCEDLSNVSIYDIVSESDKTKLKRCFDQSDSSLKTKCKVKNKKKDRWIQVEIAFSVRRTDRRYAICRII